MPPNLARVIDMELVLQQLIVGGEKLAAADFALLTASAAVRGYCRQRLDLVEDDEIVLDSAGGRLIMLPELPVVSVSEVVENGEELVLVDDYELMRFGILHRTARPWYIGIGAVAITYTHGYAVIPDLIRAVTARAASRLYQAGLRAAETAGVPGVVSKTLGDFSVTFGAESAAEGTMGASGARVLLLSEQDLLNEFRV